TLRFLLSYQPPPRGWLHVHLRRAALNVSARGRLVKGPRARGAKVQARLGGLKTVSATPPKINWRSCWWPGRAARWRTRLPAGPAPRGRRWIEPRTRNLPYNRPPPWTKVGIS